MSYAVRARELAAVGLLWNDGLFRTLDAVIGRLRGGPSLAFHGPYSGLESIGTLAPRLVAKYDDSGVTMARGRIGRQPVSRLPRVPIYTRETGHVARLEALVA